jgi:hypothetical protein
MHRSEACGAGPRRPGSACRESVRIGHNGPVTTGKRSTAGRHSGPARLGDEPPRPSRSRSAGALLQLALGITAAIVAWGYLVYLAIDFGTTARNGTDSAWWYLGLATVGAIACLFAGMMLGARLFARLRLARPAPPPSPPGGRRIAR